MATMAMDVSHSRPLGRSAVRSRSSAATTSLVPGRFSGGQISASYDWDSIQYLPETQVVGGAAASYTADWSKPITAKPTLQDMRDFVQDYETARGESFSEEERVATFAKAVYTTAYGARCIHSLEPGRAPEDWEEGSLPRLLITVADPLLS